MDSFILAIVVAVFVWLFMRRMRMKKQQQMRRQATAGEDQPEQKTMPRIGKAGTMTHAQSKALKEKEFEPSRFWSTEEAQLILDSVNYLRAVIRNETGETDTPLEVQNKVLAFILQDEELREFLLDRARNMTRDEDPTAAPEPDRDAAYARVAEFVNELWENG